MNTQPESMAGASSPEGGLLKPLEQPGGRVTGKGRTSKWIILTIALAGAVIGSGATYGIMRHWCMHETALLERLKLKQEAEALDQATINRNAIPISPVQAKRNHDLNAMEQLKLNYDGQIHEITDRMNSIATKLAQAGVGINDRGNSKEIELQLLIAEQLRVLAALGAGDAKLKAFDKQMETESAPELDEACQRSPLYADYRQQYDEARRAYNEMVATSGADGSQAAAMKRRVDSAQKRLSDAENDIKAKTAEAIRSNLVNERSAADEAVARIERRLGDIRQVIADFTKERSEYDRLAARLAHLGDKLERVMDEQDRIGYEMPAEFGK